MEQNQTGLVHVYWGDGKGKTTAAVGLAVRAAGHGGRVVFSQFLKNGRSGELAALAGLPGVTLCCEATVEKFTRAMTPGELADTARRCCAQLARAADLCSGGCSLLVLDEVLDACSLRLVGLDQLTDFLDSRPAGLEVVLTGHCLPPEVAARAGYITRMVKERHPYDSGVAARKGVEY